SVHGLAAMFECSGHSISRQLQRGWLIWACQYQGRAWFCGEIIRGVAHPLVVESGGICRYLQIRNHRTQASVLGRSQDLSGERVREERNLARGTAKPMIRHRTREGEAVLDHVKPVHGVLRRAHPAS